MAAPPPANIAVPRPAAATIAKRNSLKDFIARSPNSSSFIDGWPEPAIGLGQMGVRLRQFSKRASEYLARPQALVKAMIPETMEL
ncbi:MAG: hypothetical protein KGL48_05035 [Sphingomonadales bacterium]|nr:hypothetical protein [Sphingomonadales bacterium]MDE2568713.1 hypothetical protein [Sphingomonadales bacterium]